MGRLQEILTSLNPFNTFKELKDNYIEEVNYNKQYPFFNENNTPKQWIGKVVQDVKKRGIAEGIQDLTYPITTNPYLEPILEPIISNARLLNYKAGRPSNLVNSLLGQQDWQMANNDKKDIISPLPDKPSGKFLNPLVEDTPEQPQTPLRVNSVKPDNYNPLAGYTSKRPPSDIEQLILTASQENNINPALLASVLFQESQFNPRAVNEGSGDYGIAQISRKWHPEVTEEQAFDPTFAIPFAARLLAEDTKHFNDLNRGVAAYNVGRGSTIWRWAKRTILP